MLKNFSLTAKLSLVPAVALFLLVERPLSLRLPVGRRAAPTLARRPV